jgi:Ulp1 protease family, C-terminal catalytic domain
MHPALAAKIKLVFNGSINEPTAEITRALDPAVRDMLSDEAVERIITLMLQEVVDQVPAEKLGHPAVFAFGPTLLNFLTGNAEVKENNELKEQAQSILAKWDLNLNRGALRFMMFVACVEGCHWVTYIVDLKAGVFYVLDSMNILEEVFEIHKYYKNAVDIFVTCWQQGNKHAATGPLILKRLAVPQQTRINSCGMHCSCYISKFMDYIFFGDDFEGFPSNIVRAFPTVTNRTGYIDSLYEKYYNIEVQNMAAKKQK